MFLQLTKLLSPMLKYVYEKIDIVGVERDACGAAIGTECQGERNREGR